MYAAPAESVEAPDWSAQWLAASLVGVLIAPSVVGAVATATTMTHPGAPLRTDLISGWSATAYAVAMVLVAFVAALFGRRLTTQRRRLLFGASASAAVTGIVGAAWRFAGLLPPLMWTAREVTFALVPFAAGRAVAQLCPTGFRRVLGNITAILACANVLVALALHAGVRIPLPGIADLSALAGAVIALAVVPRRSGLVPRIS